MTGAVTAACDGGANEAHPEHRDRPRLRRRCHGHAAEQRTRRSRLQRGEVFGTTDAGIEVREAIGDLIKEALRQFVQPIAGGEQLHVATDDLTGQTEQAGHAGLGSVGVALALLDGRRPVRYYGANTKSQVFRYEAHVTMSLRRGRVMKFWSAWIALIFFIIMGSIVGHDLIIGHPHKALTKSNEALYSKGVFIVNFSPNVNSLADTYPDLLGFRFGVYFRNNGTMILWWRGPIVLTLLFGCTEGNGNSKSSLRGCGKTSAAVL